MKFAFSGSQGAGYRHVVVLYESHGDDLQVAQAASQSHDRGKGEHDDRPQSKSRRRLSIACERMPAMMKPPILVIASKIVDVHKCIGDRLKPC